MHCVARNDAFEKGEGMAVSRLTYYGEGVQDGCSFFLHGGDERDAFVATSTLKLLTLSVARYPPIWIFSSKFKFHFVNYSDNFFFFLSFFLSNVRCNCKVIKVNCDLS